MAPISKMHKITASSRKINKDRISKTRFGVQRKGKTKSQWVTSSDSSSKQDKFPKDVGFVRCPAELFPHLVYVSELTTDFLDRAKGVVEFPKSWSTLKIMQQKFNVVIQLDSSSTCSIHDSQDVVKTKHWPQRPKISVWTRDNIEIHDKVLYMSEKTFEKTIKMLNQKCLDSTRIRSVITHPDVRDVHEALTEMLETPIWKFLDEIKKSSSLVLAQSETLSMELDVLMSTVKHSSSRSSQTRRQNRLEIPEKLKDYLSRKREVFGFGLWNKKEFRVILLKDAQAKHIHNNLKTLYTDFFDVYNLKVVVCDAQMSPYLRQGDKIFRPQLDQSYLTLGCFVKDNTRRVYALTCSHGVPNKCHVNACLGNPPPRLIGKCIISSHYADNTPARIKTDVALIEIIDSVKNECHLSMVNHAFQDSKVCIHDGNLQDIAGKVHVYKIGASTSVRKGLIKSPDFTASIDRKELFVVTGLSGLPFAEGGDSGSIVFINENSSALDTIKVIGMVFGGITMNTTEDQKEQGASINGMEVVENANQSDNICCYEIKSTLEYLKENGWVVSFENQV
ncbi:uncharacterized protein LOC144620914 isoform X2 [Crassostrea virginica]